jgi:hypothetical protein
MMRILLRPLLATFNSDTASVWTTEGAGHVRAAL